MSTEGLYPIALLVDEMKSEELEVRVNAMKRLRTIAVALGPERCRDELIPFLTDQVEDEDELLLVMAEQLGGFVDVVGGPEYAVCLIELLGALATVEETVVRDQAVESAKAVIQVLDDDNVVSHVVPVIQRLTSGDWFTARISACGLFGVTYGILTDEESKTLLRALYAEMCNDDTPMVRRAAASNLGNFASMVEKHYMMEEILPLFNTLAADDQDSVRLLAIENCRQLAKLMTEDENQATVLTLVKSCAEDKSWKVRHNVAKEFYPLSESMGVSVTVEQLLPLFIKLLQDPEAEVRAAAVKNCSGYCDLLGPSSFASQVLPALRSLMDDQTQSVRIALADSIMELASKLANDVATSQLVPMVMQFLRDEIADVRLKILDKLDNLAKAITPDLLNSSVLPSVVALGADAQWRVREKVIEKMPILASILGAADFESKLLNLYLSTYHDQVNSVRMAATRVMQPLSSELGAGWCAAKLVPKLRELFDSDGNYLQRITVLYGIKYLFCSEEMAALATDLLPIVLRAASDSVPNVRFVAAKVLADGISILDAGRIATEIKPTLEALLVDEDADVKFFADHALHLCA